MKSYVPPNTDGSMSPWWRNVGQEKSTDTPKMVVSNQGKGLYDSQVPGISWAINSINSSPHPPVSPEKSIHSITNA